MELWSVWALWRLLQRILTLLSTTINLLHELSDVYYLVTDEEKNLPVWCLTERQSGSVTRSNLVLIDQLPYRRTLTFYFLYCNVHFLLGLSSSCKSALNDTEKSVCSSGSVLGWDSPTQFKNWTSSSESATGRPIRTTAFGGELFEEGNASLWVCLKDLKVPYCH